MYGGLDKRRVSPGLPSPALEPLLGDKAALTEVDVNEHTGNRGDNNDFWFGLIKNITVVILACAG